MTTIWIMSDLHVDAAPWTPPPGPLVDLAIVAGDIANGLTRRSIPWLVEHVVPRARHVAYIPGNHDFYGTRHPRELAHAHEVAIAVGIRLLEAGQWFHVDGIQVVGATMWTDYAIGEPRWPRAYAMSECGDRERGMRDHRRIQTLDRAGMPSAFRTPQAAALHAEHRDRLERVLSEPTVGLRIVVTHHAPSARSLLGGRVEEPTDAAYASDMESLMQSPHAPDLWIHGHVHRSRDYVLGRTRVLSNPRGHAGENPSFDPFLTVTL